MITFDVNFSFIELIELCTLLMTSIFVDDSVEEIEYTNNSILNFYMKRERRYY